MTQKNILLIILSIIFLILFISGCIKLIEKKSIEQTLTIKESNISKANQKIVTSLKNKLNSVVNNYEISYKKEHEVHSWAGHSGSTDYTEKSEIFIKVNDSQVTNYTIKYIKEGFPVKEEDFYKIYNFTNKELCQKDFVSNSNCEKKIPPNIDSQIKSNILSYLENINIVSIIEENNQYGHCYSFFHDRLKHTFCFNKQDIIIFAQWGKDIREKRSTNVDINKIKVI